MISAMLSSQKNRPMGTNHDVTALLKAWEEGDQTALQALADAVYSELKRLAAYYMANERPGHTLETGALINEAFVHLVDLRQPKWQNRNHFYCMAARMMRRVLVDYARSRNYKKRGAGAHAVTLTGVGIVSLQRSAEFLALDEALRQLGETDERKAQVVELRFFGGFSMEEIAAILDVSTVTVVRDWRFAKAWLERTMSGDAR
jgi:RNA polymerase sigma factor (TIGR02999 family)